MIYTISKNKITLYEENKRNYPNGGKNKSNAEERRDEESYYKKSNKKQKKGGALSSTLAVKDMSSALSQGGAEEDEDTSYVNNILQLTGIDIPLTESDQLYGNIPNVANLTLPELYKISEIEGIIDYKSKSKNQLLNLLKPTIALRKKETANKRDKIRIQAYHKKDRNVLLDKVSQQRKTLRLSKFASKYQKPIIEKGLVGLKMNTQYEKELKKRIKELEEETTKITSKSEITINIKKGTNAYFETGKYDDKGVSFENYIIKNYQDLLKSLFSNPSTQTDFILSLNDYSVYDADNDRAIIEFKFYNDEKSYVEIQLTKFVGITSKLYGDSIPLFYKVNGKWKFYNLKEQNKKKYVYSQKPRDLSIIVYKPDGIYEYSITDNFESLPFIPVTTLTNGIQLFKIFMDETNVKDKTFFGPFEGSNRDRLVSNVSKSGFYDEGDETPKHTGLFKWLKIPLKDFKKIT